MKTIALNFVAIALNFTAIALNFAAITLNFAAMALLMPLTRGRPLMISTIGGHSAPSASTIAYSHNLISPDVGRKSGDS